jgi:hypothetical protein
MAHLSVRMPLEALLWSDQRWGTFGTIPPSSPYKGTEQFRVFAGRNLIAVTNGTGNAVPALFRVNTPDFRHYSA